MMNKITLKQFQQGTDQPTDNKFDFNHRINKLRISLTNQCNYKCIFCHNEGGDLSKCSKERITPANIKVITEAATSLGIQRFTITGGEPFLNPEVLAILEEIKKVNKEINISLTTNGLLIGEHEIAKLADFVSKISLNFQGIDPATFEQMTGVPQINKIKKFIDLALGAGVKVCLNFVYTSKNQQELNDIISYAVEKGIDVKVIEFIKDRDNSSLHADMDKLHSKLLANCSHSEIISKSEEVFYFDNTKTTVRIIYSYCNNRDVVACNNHGELRITPSLELKPCLKDKKTQVSIREDVDSGNITAIKAKILKIISHSNKCP